METFGACLGVPGKQFINISKNSHFSVILIRFYQMVVFPLCFLVLNVGTEYRLYLGVKERISK